MKTRWIVALAAVAILGMTVTYCGVRHEEEQFLEWRSVHEQDERDRVEAIIEERGWSDAWPVVTWGGSMAPTLGPEPVVVIVRPIPFDEIQSGEIIVARFPDDPENGFAHRVATRSESFLITKGDANKAVDRWRITEEHYIGRVVIP